MRRIFPLKSLSFASSGRGVVELDVLPSQARLKGILLSMPARIQQPGSGMALIPGYTLSRLFDSIVIGKRIRTTGSLLDKLWWLMSGRDPGQPADVPATASFDARRIVNCYVPFADFDSLEPDDTSPATSMFRDTPLELGFGASASLLGATVTFTPDQVGVLAVVEEVKPGQVATPVTIDYADQPNEARLPSGIYTHMAIVKEDGTAISSTEVSDLTVYVDGVPVLDRITVSQLATIYNTLKAQGGEFAQGGGTTQAIPGEGVTDQPLPTTGAAATVSPDFLPLLYPQRRGKLTKAWVASAGVRVKWSGSATNLRFLYRQVEGQSEDQVVRAASKMGLQARAVKSRTVSKTDNNLPPLLKAVLPKQVF